MKTRLLFLLLFIGFMSISQAQVSINEDASDPHESAMLDVSSTNKGLLIPRMSSEERIAIINPANGLMVFDLGSNTFWFYSESTTQWEEMGGAIVSVLNDLLDAKTDANSIYIGEQSGQNDDGDNFNVAIGSHTLKNNTNGKNNTALGYAAMQDKTFGDNNTAIGNSAMEKNTNGIENTVMGSNALFYNQTGNRNVAVGSNALQQNTGSSNTAIGTGAGSNAANSMGSIFVGYEAGKNETQNNKLYIENSSSYLPLIGGDFSTDEVIINGTLSITGGNPTQGKVLTSDNNGNASWEVVNGGANEINELTDAITDDNSLYVGAESGINDLGNNYNTALGQQSLKKNTSGQSNTAIGLGALLENTSGKENTALGLASLYNNKTGENNVAVGYSSLAFANIAGSGNVAVGDRSLLMNAGSENTALGKGAGQNSNDNASGNVFIGYEAGKEEDGSNKLYIENSASTTPLIGGDFDTDKVIINGELSVQDELKVYNTTTIYGHLNTFSDINTQKNLIVNDSITTSNIKITAGNPVAGKVLTTDDFGNASWEDSANSGAQELNDLSDAKTEAESIYIGANSGDNDYGDNSNTSVGYQSLMNNTGGSSNSTFGKQAMISNTHGGNNTAIGPQSLYFNTTGDNNVAIGGLALYNNTGGNFNTVLGYQAGKGTANHNISGSVFIGQKAGYNETEDNKLYIENTSSSTPLIGGDFSTDEVVINGTLQITGGNPGSGKVLVSDADGKGSWSNSAGASSINDLIDAKNDNSSIFLGTTGATDDGNNSNTAIGISALNANQIGTYNAAFGKSALANNNSGAHNAAYGASSMELNTNGVNNTAIGSGALYNNGSGTGNTALGFEAGFGSYGANSSGNLFLGYKAGYHETGSNKLYIDNSDTYYPLVYGDFNENKLEVNGEFKVANGSYSNLIVNDTKLEANVNIEANANVDIAGDLTIEGQTITNGPFMANDEIRANDQIIANGPILANHEIRAFDKIIAYDDIILSDNKNIKYENTRTGKLQLSGADFTAYVNTFDDYSWSISNYNSVIHLTQFDEAEFYVEAPIHLPKGAIITSYTVHYTATTGSSLTFSVKKRVVSSKWSYEELSRTDYISNSDEQSSNSANVFTNPIIDEDHIFIFQVHGYPELNESGYSNFDLIGLTIEYEYDTLNH